MMRKTNMISINISIGLYKKKFIKPLSSVLEDLCPLLILLSFATHIEIETF